MKIVQTPARFHPYVGGVENTVYSLSRELVRQGHRVKVICANEPPGPEIVEGIEVLRLHYPFKIANTNVTPGLLGALMREEYDLIHTHLPCPWSADLSAFACRKKNKPLFLSYHNDIMGRGINKFIAAGYNLTLLRLLLSTARKIFIANSNYLEYSPFLKPYSKKVVVCPFGVDTQRFKPGPEPSNKVPVIFFLSKLDRYHRYKGLEKLFEAMKDLKQEYELRIGGEGELLNEFKGLASRLGLSDRVTFLGRLDEGRVEQEYANSDIFVLASTSRQEGFGLVALEAMASRSAVVVSSIVGVSERIRREHAGLVVEPGDIGQLREAISFLLSNPKERKESAENAYRLVLKEFSWSRYAGAIIREYSS